MYESELVITVHMRNMHESDIAQYILHGGRTKHADEFTPCAFTTFKKDATVPRNTHKRRRHYTSFSGYDTSHQASHSTYHCETWLAPRFLFQV
jgi:hypothetical protein